MLHAVFIETKKGNPDIVQIKREYLNYTQVHIKKDIQKNIIKN